MFYKIRYAAAAFAAGIIIMGTALAFAAVDMSTEKYMPGEFGALFRINSLDRDGAAFTLAGEDYSFDAEDSRVTELLHRFRGLSPPGPRLARQIILALSGREIQGQAAPR
ncbi:hypothetical protein FACS1894191_3300 [Clostridia bacterium]|nr:hypothetical protein FACS1894191_3300 [Clostridia bacterium]